MAKTLPVMLLKDFTILPSQTLKVEPSTKLSLATIELSEQYYEKELIIVSPKDTLEENPEVEDLPTISVIVKIKKKIILPNNHVRITFEGGKRVKISKYFNDSKNKNLLLCNYFILQNPVFEESEVYAYQKQLNHLLKYYLENKRYHYDEEKIKNQSLDELTDFIASFLPLSLDKKKKYMEDNNALNRAKNLVNDFTLEIKVLDLERKIEASLQQELDEEQKKYILREKIVEIQKELGEENKKTLEVEEYKEKLSSLNISHRTKRKIQNEIEKYEFMNEQSPDISFVRNYLELFFSLPWNEETIENEDLKSIEKSLNKTHYGLKQVKTRILEYAAMKKRNPFLQAPIICLVGPPGVGKSTIASSIASALHREFYKISVGGLNDSAELTGHRRTYLGSAPGRIITALQKCNSKNPLILIDEVDKMVKDYKGDPASVLLDILDPNLNQNFIDAYLEEPFDLSHVLFFLTANRIEEIPNELKDRLEIIELSSYSTLEKISLAKEYLLPLLRLDYHVREDEIKITDEAIKDLILNYTNEAGVRELRRKLEELYRKVILNGEKTKQNLEITLEKKDIQKILEEKITIADLEPKINTCGLVKGLAVTNIGGVTLPIEAVMYDGSGKTFVTGSLGDVMKESIDVVLSFIKNNQKKFAIPSTAFKKKDIHIHALDGATLKDGPSAGVAITTCFISLLTHRQVPLDVAMTGEMSLRGEVLPVGGIKEKVIGAYNRGIKKIFLPEANKVDMKLVSKDIKKEIEIIYVKEYKEIYKSLFK